MIERNCLFTAVLRFGDLTGAMVGPILFGFNKVRPEESEQHLVIAVSRPSSSVKTVVTPRVGGPGHR